MTEPPLLLHVFSTFVAAGPEVRAVKLISAFGSRFRHVVVSMDGRTSAAELLPTDVDVRLVREPPRRGSLRTTPALMALLRRARPDLLLTYNWGAFDALMAARLLGMRQVVHHEDGFNADEAFVFKRRRALARRVVLRRIQRVIVPSIQLEQVASRVWRLPADSIRRIPNGIVFSAVVPGCRAQIRAAIGIPAAAAVIGTVAHLRPEKRLDRLLHAVANLTRHPNAHLLIVGDGPEHGALGDVARQHGVAERVHFVGHQTDVQSYLAAMDVYAITSDTEQMPVSLLEAMASGLPVVSTKVGDVVQMLPPEQAEFVVDGDRAEPSLATCLDRLLDQPQLRRALGQQNQQRSRAEFGFERMTTSYLAEYSRAIRDGASDSTW